MLSRISSIDSDFSDVTNPGGSPLASVVALEDAPHDSNTALAVFNPPDPSNVIALGQAPGFILGAHAARAQPARRTRMSRALLDDSDEDAGCGDDAPPPFAPSAEQEQKAAFDKADLALKTAQAKDAANKLNQKRQEEMDAAYDNAKDDFINAPDANARDSAKIKLARMMKARNPNIKPLSLTRQINDLIRKPRVKK